MFYIAAVTRIVELGVSSRTVAWLLKETQILNRTPGNDDSRRSFRIPDQSFFQKDS